MEKNKVSFKIKDKIYILNKLDKEYDLLSLKEIFKFPKEEINDHWKGLKKPTDNTTLTLFSKEDKLFLLHCLTYHPTVEKYLYELEPTDGERDRFFIEKYKDRADFIQDMKFINKALILKYEEDFYKE